MSKDFEIERDIETVRMVYCQQNSFPSDPISLKKCESCTFFNGEKDGGKISCLYDRSVLKPRARHVLKFESGGKMYEAHRMCELSDDEFEFFKKDYDSCPWCCFNRKLNNGEEYCFLRRTVEEGELDSFRCYEDEFWTCKEIEDE